LAGPVLGAALVVLLKNVASAYIDRWIMLLGIVYVLIVLFLPGGIVGGIERLLRRLGRMGGQGSRHGDAATPARVREASR
ncbi:MAG: urea ABC transporter permease subunit UrtC, partial [Caldimonas sp.]